ncbi:MAG: hypothetical protein ISR48_00485 [Alphaproteobacteria bacterium]|nr:hypothetical protein [Alphaproteobacteria bacterium]
MSKDFDMIYVCESGKTKEEMVDLTYRIKNKNSLFNPELQKQFLIFNHINRTGGAVINDILFRMQDKTSLPLIIPAEDLAYSDDPPWEGKSAPLVITAHYLFGLHERLREPSSYFTIMREPHSHFLTIFLRRNKDYKYAGSHMGEIWSNLERKIDEIREKIGHCNIQTYEHAVYYKNRPNPATDIYPGFFENMNNTTAEGLFSTADNNIKNMFFFVGITELFEESLFTLFDMLGIQETLMWRPGLYTYWRPTKDEMPIRLRKKLSAMLEADLELYHSNRHILENMLEKSNFGDELIRYKQHARNPYNRLYLELSERFPVAAETFGYFSEVVDKEFRHSRALIRNIQGLSLGFQVTRAEREAQKHLESGKRGPAFRAKALLLSCKMLFYKTLNKFRCR